MEGLPAVCSIRSQEAKISNGTSLGIAKTILGIGLDQQASLSASLQHPFSRTVRIYTFCHLLRHESKDSGMLLPNSGHTFLQIKYFWVELLRAIFCCVREESHVWCGKLQHSNMAVSIHSIYLFGDYNTIVEHLPSGMICYTEKSRPSRKQRYTPLGKKRRNRRR
ncbi:hypothetical protein JTE90_001884 [Oedothorax gibbosus]|uniref:Uncharacterized protein n=1 Tax=Oedothorax gibbosus TaxID=931172 RepID=A0AAV6VPK9_9ARAC|nr:hypothetical protein JTE90_001884 [Oedothorax gibbosus]